MENKYPIEIGNRGEDDYYLRYANGKIVTWDWLDKVLVALAEARRNNDKERELAIMLGAIPIE